MKYILLPSKHLSWSQIDLWQKNPREYRRVYFEGGERFTNQAMKYGSKFATMMETGDAGGDEILKFASILVPKYEVPEYCLKAELKTEEGLIPLLGFLDSSHDNPVDGFREYKTGTQPWNQRRVDNHGQLTLYATMVYLKHQTFCKTIHLDWLPTENLNGRIELTGELHSFETKRSMQDILTMTATIRMVAGQISGAYRQYLDTFF